MGGRSKLFVAAALLAGFLTAGFAQNNPTNGAIIKLQLTTTAFTPGQPIPSRHAFDKEDISTALQWSGVPPTAKSLALICDDPDAPVGTWVHWVLYDLPPNTPGLSEGQPRSPELPGGGKQGMNDYKKTGYGGPCPPPGKAHRYFFRLYALDAKPDLKPGLTKAQLLKALAGHVLAEGELMGTYQK